VWDVSEARKREDTGQRTRHTLDAYRDLGQFRSPQQNLGGEQ